MLATKPGNGGHGLEVYNVEDGKYAQVTCSFNGKDINSWEEYRDAILATNPQYKSAYDSNQSIAQQFDALIQDDWYPKLVQEEVDRLNEDGESRISFSSPSEAGANIHKLFGKKLVNNLLENGILDNDDIVVNPYKPNYKVNIFAACIQMNRYEGNNRMKPITQQEYDARSNNFPIKSLGIFTSNADLHDYLQEATEIPLLRNMLAKNYDNNAIWPEVQRSFWDPTSPVNSLLADARGKNCSYYGSVIYMSTGGYSYGGYNKHAVMGIAKPQEMKLLRIDNYDDGCKEVTDFLRAYENNRAQIDSAIQQNLVSTGKCTPQQAERITQRLFNQITSGGENRWYPDYGLCAMIMGYDAIYGNHYHFDILNPNKVEVVRE